MFYCYGQCHTQILQSSYCNRFSLISIFQQPYCQLITEQHLLQSSVTSLLCRNLIFILITFDKAHKIGKQFPPHLHNFHPYVNLLSETNLCPPPDLQPIMIPEIRLRYQLSCQLNGNMQLKCNRPDISASLSFLLHGQNPRGALGIEDGGGIGIKDLRMESIFASSNSALGALAAIPLVDEKQLVSLDSVHLICHYCPGELAFYYNLMNEIDEKIYACINAVRHSYEQIL